MKPSTLPTTPLDALKISGALKVIVKTIHTSADIFKSWKYPSPTASADFETMSLMDKIYWGYKSKKPVLYPEPNTPPAEFIKRNNTSIKLPADFNEVKTVTFSAVGDLIKVNGLENSKDKFYEKISDLVFDAGISYANLESQLTSQDIGGYTFSDKETPPLCCTQEEYETLKGYNGKQYTLMHTACNHTFDMGIEGLETTLVQLAKDNIIDLGTNREPDEQQKAKIIEVKGIKFGFISATFGLNGKEIPKGKEYTVNVVKFHPLVNKKMIQSPDLSLLYYQIDDCKRQECDVIVASLHWGYEYEFFPRNHQVNLAHELVEMGVDVILSHHAHVLQPVEYFHPKYCPEKTAVIVYSLGNLSSSFSAPHIVLSGVINLTFAGGKWSGKDTTFIKEVKLTPVVQQDYLENNLPVITLERLDTLSDKKDKDEEEAKYIADLERYAEQVGWR